MRSTLLLISICAIKNWGNNSFLDVDYHGLGICLCVAFVMDIIELVKDKK